MDGLDYEYVKIGNFPKLAFPSDICVNREVFNQIFSTDTWNKVLMPDQRERILNFLPPEVLQTVGASQQTMEDLLARTLNRFDTNPLDTFFEQLEQGRFDPDVVETRAALQKAWHKESIRKRKKYHSELLQEVIVSREKHLKQRLDSCSNSSSLFNDIYSFDEPSLPPPSITTPSYTVYNKSQVKNLNSFESQVEKRYREEISSINRQAGCLSSSDDESPPKKSAKMSRKATTKPSKAKRAKPVVKVTPVLSESMAELSVQSPLNCTPTNIGTPGTVKHLQSSIVQMTPKSVNSIIPTTTISVPGNMNRGPLLTLLPNQSAVTTALITTHGSSTSSNLHNTLSSPSTYTSSLLSSNTSNRNTISVLQSHLNNPSAITTVSPQATKMLLSSSSSSSSSSTSTMIPVVISSTPGLTIPTTVTTTTPSGGIVIAGIKIEGGLLSSASSPVSSFTSTTTTTTSTPNIAPLIHFQNNPSKSSPILASQLQAPTQLTMSINNSNHHHQRVNSSNINYSLSSSTSTYNKDSFKFPSIQNQNIKVRNCSEEEMESSSDDEFESIEPTIHLFASNPITTSSNSLSKLPPKTNLGNSKSTTLNNNSGNLNKSRDGSTMNKNINSSNKMSLQHQQLLIATSKPSTVTTLGSSSSSSLTSAASSSSLSSSSGLTTFSNSPKYTHVQFNKVINVHQQSQGQGQSPLQQQQQPKVNIVKVVAQTSSSSGGSNVTFKNTYSSKIPIGNIKIEPGTFSSGVPQNILVQAISSGINATSTITTAATSSSNIITSNSSIMNSINNTIRVSNPKVMSTTTTGITTNSTSTQKLLPITLQNLQQQQQQLQSPTADIKPLLSTLPSPSSSIIRPTMLTLPATTTNSNSNQIASSIPITSSSSSLVTLNGPLSVPVNSIISLNSNNNSSIVSGNSGNSDLINNTSTSSNTSTNLSCVTSNLGTNNNSTAGIKLESVGELQMFNLLNQPNINVMDALGGDLNLNLSLSMNRLDDEGMGDDDVVDFVDQKYAKLPDMEKIDDFQCMDGNPFDSIPNLSDELDAFLVPNTGTDHVLDLDLVEGLCDFDGFLSEEKQYASFFSLIRDVLCSTRDHRMTLQVLEKTIRKWSITPSAALNLWFLRVNDWNEALITALNFLAGNYQGSFKAHPEDFVPYIEYKYKTKYYQWIGAGRDSDNNLTALCHMWLENVDRLPPLKKLEAENEDQEEEDDENEDSDGVGEEAKAKKTKRPQTPPPPRCLTDWSVRPSTKEEKEVFQKQERSRFENPHKAFTYQMHGYESVVGPVKGVYSSQSGMTNKARGHSLLVDDRPPYVTILALVRDAVARLPNGEGTRSEICEMLRDSAFLAAEASNVTLNSVVSGALDRLHYERDPCVRYDSHKKSWVYLHRDRTQEQFERLHHNRSYTKSTKSRSNSSRKNRKQGSKSQSQSSSPGSSGNTKDTIIVITTTAPPTSTSATTSTLLTTTLGSSLVSTSTSTTTAPKPSTISTSSSTTTTTGASTTPIVTPSTIGSSIMQQQQQQQQQQATIPTKLPPVGTLIAKTTLNPSNAPVLQFTSNVRPMASTATTAPTVSTSNDASKSKVNQVTPAKHTIVTATNAEGVVKQIFNVDNPQIVSSSTPVGINIASDGIRPGSHSVRKLPLNEVLAASLGSTIRFATIPTSSSISTSSMGLTSTHTYTNSAINVVAGNVEQSGAGSNIVTFRTSGGNIITSVAGSSSTITTPTTQTINTIANHANRLTSTQPVAVQVQSVSTSGSNNSTNSSATAKGQGTPLTISQPTGANTTVNPGQQLILNPQTLIRLANTLRLPEGVRFAQVRFPTQQTTPQQQGRISTGYQPVIGGSSPVRIPQQRIILTRAAVSGQNQTQGVFLGTTPQGQTILLSAPGLGHLSGTSQLPISITTSQGSSIDTSNISISTASVGGSSQQQQQAHVHMTPMSSATTNANRPSGTISIMTNAHIPGGNIVSRPPGSNITQISAPASTVVISSAGNTTMMPIISHTSSSGNVLQTVASQHLVSQVASQIQQQHQQQHSQQQQQQHTAHTTTQLSNTSPIFVYPSQFALGGRGIQTIKVIPVQTAGGKQTVLARFVTPKTSQAQTLSGPSSNSQQP